MSEKLAVLEPLVARQGLGATGNKLRAGRPCAVAYLGGSITWGGNASDVARYSYRALTTAGLRARFPACEIHEIDAGIGGTGSDLGAFRLAADALDAAPDLLFIEFAVNDSGRGDASIAVAMEGIVRQCLRSKSPPELAFIYTLAQGHLEQLSRGALPPSAAAHERIAEHYGIPSINVAAAVAQRLAANDLKWDDFSKDNCHPTDAGHAMYALTIAAALTALFEHTAIARPAELPRPLTEHPHPWETARCIAVPTQPHAFPGWNYRTLQKRGGWDCFSGVLESNTPGSEAHFELNATAIGLYYLLGPETGDLLYSIDDGPFEALRSFDAWSPGCWRPHYRMLRTDLKPGPHTLRIRVSDQHDPQSKGLWTKLAYVLCL